MNMRVEMNNKKMNTKCLACRSYVVPPRRKLEENPIYAGEYCKNPRSPYFMRRPAGRCDCFAEDEG